MALIFKIAITTGIAIWAILSALEIRGYEYEDHTPS